MKKSLILLATFLLGTLSATAQAQNYYVCDNGNDSNDGRTEAKPFKSYEKAMDTFNKMNAGDSVLFCRGGVFPQSKGVHLYNKKCTASSTCTIGDYGNKNLVKPLIVSNGNTSIRFQEGANADPDGGYVVKNLTLMGDSKSKANGIDMYNDVDDVTIENLHIEGFRIGIRSAGAGDLNPGTNGINDRLLVKNSTIIGNFYQGFYGSCQDCSIENNVFENNGYSQRILTHNIYLGAHKPANGMKIKNNLLYKSARYDGVCSGVSLVVHGKFNGLVIEGNTIKEDLGKTSGHCWGIGIDPGYSHEDEYFTNTVIRNNKLINVGNVGIGCASCDGAIIEGNEIIDEGSELRAGIKIPSKIENSVKSKNITIKNNKVILNHLTGNGVSIGGVNKFNVMNNDIKLPVDTKTDCFDKYDANINTDTSKNTCTLHNGVSIIDIIEEETEVVENTPEEPVQEQPVVTEPETEVVENTPEEPVQEQPVVTEPETEVVENTPEDPVEEQPVVTEPETEVVENTPEAPVQQEPVVTEPETEVVDSGNDTETVTSFERPSWASPRPTSSSNFTYDNLIESMQNDYTNESASECRFFARGKCLIR
ncbi:MULTISPECIES: hypothetical protein [unclassified Methylophaga]|jgi:hypothetical protein|uniref:hypothetical protein n=2 Tax=Methylophaga TaxID=40222 RepID=UPI000C890C2F|nr:MULTISPECIES: hypothetical protein [unclassified Methylophaga]MAK67298.1 hypothetical protein [Methylophaga sp.]MAY18335.1 hypothetical protein [Methylophaga sp.]HCD05802.1 hypothetical protein [Methylophaga sp.]|tara:strand:- start:10760 stop:12535 length:1776 start_codon:yes stop_codon:yes gene_type:complete